MRSLEDSGAQIVLVVDDRGHLRGTLTDGDVRRALLAGAGLDATVGAFASVDNLSVPKGSSRASVLELMTARQIRQIPELDEDGVVVGLHLIGELLGSVVRPNSAVILAGGRGARLAPLTETIPKPMLTVAGRPILERIVLHLVGSGVRHIWLSVNYLAETIEAHFGSGHQFGCSIEYLRETKPLGTAGPLSLLRTEPRQPEDPLLVMNGDLVTEANVGSMLDIHTRTSPAATIAVRRYFQQTPFGCVEVDDGQVVGFTEKPTLERLISAGIYVLDPSCIDLVGDGEALGMPDLLTRIRSQGGVVRVFELGDDWIDVGRHEELSRARLGE
jgi:dTDP-glucose pyrophosphorylase